MSYFNFVCFIQINFSQNAFSLLQLFILMSICSYFVQIMSLKYTYSTFDKLFSFIGVWISIIDSGNKAGAYMSVKENKKREQTCEKLMNVLKRLVFNRFHYVVQQNDRMKTEHKNWRKTFVGRACNKFFFLKTTKWMNSFVNM